MVRPTGFGKTYIMAQLAKRYKRVLFLYPLNIIEEEVKHKYSNILGEHVVYMTYMKLVHIHKNNRVSELSNKFDLVICDEAHMTGADKTFEAINSLMVCCKGTKFIGVKVTKELGKGIVQAQCIECNSIKEYTKSQVMKHVYSHCGCKNSIKGEVYNNLKK